MTLEKSQLKEKWKPILEGTLDGEDLGVDPIDDQSREEITAQLLENQLNSIKFGDKQTHELLKEGVASFNSSNVAGWQSVLIKLVRRCTPNFAAHDLVGVQPLKTPTGIVFARHATYANKAAPNNIAGFGLPDTAYSGISGDGTDGWDQGTGVAPDGTGPNPGGPLATDYELDPFAAAGYTTGTAMETARGEGCVIPKMSMEFTKVTVTAKSRQLCASLNQEVEEDLRNLHGLEAKQELAMVVADELVQEVNAELMRTIIRVAKLGAQNTVTPGTLDLTVDSTGRFKEERLRDLLFQIEVEANTIGYETRMGRGNWIMTTPNIASALSIMGRLSGACCNKEDQLTIDPCNGYAGVLDGKYKVYVDPWNNTFDYVVVGYKGSNQESGIYYAPYVPFSVVHGQADCNGNPQMFFKTRYGVVSNPFVLDPVTGNPDGENLTPNINQFYRKFAVLNITA